MEEIWFDRIEQKIQLEKLLKIKVELLANLGQPEDALEAYKDLVKHYYFVKETSMDKKKILDTLKAMEAQFNKPVIFGAADSGGRHDFDDVMMEGKLRSSLLNRATRDKNTKK